MSDKLDFASRFPRTAFLNLVKVTVFAMLDRQITPQEFEAIKEAAREFFAGLEAMHRS